MSTSKMCIRDSLISAIVSVPIDDGVKFQLKSISEIMDEAEYPGIRVSMTAIFDGVVTPLKIDISTGDAITPREVRYSFKQMCLRDRIKALCAGEPRIKERMDLDVEVSRLKLMKADHQSKQYRLEDQLLKYFPQEIETNKGYIQGFEAVSYTHLDVYKRQEHRNTGQKVAMCD